MFQCIVSTEGPSAGVATLTWDCTGRSMNVLDEPSLTSLREHIEALRDRDDVRGVILTSDRDHFAAGADLELVTGLFAMRDDPARLVEAASVFQHTLRALETCGIPTVAALPGTALGGALEVALACRHRILADNPRARIGLPEVSLGLLPGAGGTQRLPRMIGFEAALPLLLEGKKLSPAKALKAGLVDDVVEPDALIAAALAWLDTEPSAVAPWDARGYRVPGGAVQSKAGMQAFTAGNAMVRQKTYGNYPAPHAILSCVYEGLQVPIDVGLAIETRHFVRLLRSEQARAMTRTLFFHLQEANKLARRPALYATRPTHRLGMLGAGMMGAGIAYVSAAAGIDVALLDRDLASAERGKAYAANVLDKLVRRKRKTDADKEAILARIEPTTDYSALEGCDLIVEAVFEDRALKADVTARAEAVVGPNAVFGTNTSTLPITGLAEASKRPANFIGIHFFSPVDRMPLVEVIRGEKTSDEALAATLDYVRQIGKTPIVVNDSRGFYTSRVFSTYVLEGVAMLAEGVDPALIENTGRMAGMPVSPLALADEVAIQLLYQIRKQTRADLGDAYVPHPGDALIDAMIEAHGRAGKAAGAGFYEYPEAARKHLWPGLREHWPARAAQPSAEELVRRFLFVQAVDAARCLEEGVLLAPQDADVGAILGWGFAPWTGGPLSYVDMLGAPAFVTEASLLAEAHGPRFEPPELLRSMAQTGAAFYPES